MCGICGELRFGGGVRSRGAHCRHARHARAPRTRLAKALRVAGSPRRPRVPAPAHHRSEPRGRSAASPTKTASVQVVFNGEIYNFRALRDELAAQGPPFPIAVRHGSDRPPVRGGRRRGDRPSRRHVRDRDLGRASQAAGRWPAIAPARSRSSIRERQTRLRVRLGNQGVLRSRRSPDRDRSRRDSVLLHSRLRPVSADASTRMSSRSNPQRSSPIDADGRTEGTVYWRLSLRPAERRRGAGDGEPTLQRACASWSRARSNAG